MKIDILRAIAAEAMMDIVGQPRAIRCPTCGASGRLSKLGASGKAITCPTCRGDKFLVKLRFQ